MPTEIGEFISGTDVRVAVESTVRMWAPDYLGAAAVNLGFERGALPAYSSYVGQTELDHFVEEQIPGCVILTPGTVGGGHWRRGKYELSWTIAIISVVAGQTREGTLRLAEAYALALRLMMLQKGSLGGVADGVQFLGERYNELTGDDSRTIAAAYSQFVFTFERAAERGGPLTPGTGGDDWPAVVSVGIATERSV